MTNEFYEKTPSLSLRLRVLRGREVQQQDSNTLEQHSSLFDLIRVSVWSVCRRMLNDLEFSRISSNMPERRTEVLHG